MACPSAPGGDRGGAAALSPDLQGEALGLRGTRPERPGLQLPGRLQRDPGRRPGGASNDLHGECDPLGQTEARRPVPAHRHGGDSAQRPLGLSPIQEQDFTNVVHHAAGLRQMGRRSTAPFRHNSLETPQERIGRGDPASRAPTLSLVRGSERHALVGCRTPRARGDAGIRAAGGARGWAEIAPGHRGASVVPGVAADVEVLAPMVAWISAAVAANDRGQKKARGTARA